MVDSDARVAPVDLEDSGELAGSLSQWQLIRLRFGKHRLAVVSLYVLVVLYGMAIFAEFFAPYTQSWKDLSYAYCPPTLPSYSLQHGIYA